MKSEEFTCTSSHVGKIGSQWWTRPRNGKEASIQLEVYLYRDETYFSLRGRNDEWIDLFEAKILRKLYLRKFWVCSMILSMRVRPLMKGRKAGLDSWISQCWENFGIAVVKNGSETWLGMCRRVAENTVNENDRRVLWYCFSDFSGLSGTVNILIYEVCHRSYSSCLWGPIHSFTKKCFYTILTVKGHYISVQKQLYLVIYKNVQRKWRQSTYVESRIQWWAWPWKAI